MSEKRKFEDEFELVTKLETKIKELENELTTLKKATAICDDCGAFLTKESTNYYETSKWGYERPFCVDCVMHCEECDQDYVEDMSYKHKDCRRDDEFDSEEEEIIKDEEETLPKSD